MPGARGDLGLATRWRFRGELGATPCPPKIRIGSLLRATFCSELQRGCLQGYGGAARLRRAGSVHGTSLLDLEEPLGRQGLVETLKTCLAFQGG